MVRDNCSVYGVAAGHRAVTLFWFSALVIVYLLPICGRGFDVMA